MRAGGVLLWTTELLSDEDLMLRFLDDLSLSLVVETDDVNRVELFLVVVEVVEV